MSILESETMPSARSEKPLNEPIPVYRRIEDDLRERIRTGKWIAGTMLPGRKNLAGEYKVDLRTLQRAISSLLADGTLRADDRRGTFVAENALFPSANAPALAGGVSLSSAPKDKLPPTLGIVAAQSPSVTNGAALMDGWERVIVASLEREFTARGGLTRYAAMEKTASISSLGEAIDTLIAVRVNALVIIDIYDTPALREQTLDHILRAPVPIVYVCWDDIRAPVPHVFYDQGYAGYQAAQHLLTQGYRSLIFFAPFEAQWAAERLNGAREAVRAAKLPPETLRVLPEIPRYTQFTLPHDQGSYEVLCEILAQQNPFAVPGVPGIIAANDSTAAGALRALNEFGLTMERDFGIIGFDDSLQARELGLSSLRPPLEELGEEAARVLYHALNGKKTRTQVRLSSHLIARASSYLQRE